MSLFTIAVSGWREYSGDPAPIATAIREAVQMKASGHDPVVVLLTGDAKGVDDIAYKTAVDSGWTAMRFKAHWKLYGVAAGPIRNQAIIDRKPDVLLAFVHPKSRGTKDIIHRARKAGIVVEMIAIPA